MRLIAVAASLVLAVSWAGPALAQASSRTICPVTLKAGEAYLDIEVHTDRGEEPRPFLSLRLPQTGATATRGEILTAARIASLPSRRRSAGTFRITLIRADQASGLPATLAVGDGWVVNGAQMVMPLLSLPAGARPGHFLAAAGGRDHYFGFKADALPAPDSDVFDVSMSPMGLGRGIITLFQAVRDGPEVELRVLTNESVAASARFDSRRADELMRAMPAVLEQLMGTDAESERCMQELIDLDAG